MELGAAPKPRNSEASSASSGSQESLHTGLTGELEEKLHITKPGESAPAASDASGLKETPEPKQDVIMIADSPAVKRKPDGKGFEPATDVKKQRILQLRQGLVYRSVA